MRIALALLKGLVVVILLLGIVLIVSRYVEVPKTHLAAMTHHKSEPLTNNNLVDVLSEHIDTTTLSAIKLQHGVLQVELLLKQDETIQEQLYRVVPMYIALAFYYGNNIEQLKLKVYREEKFKQEQQQLLQLTIHQDDVWLEKGLEQLEDIHWLEDRTWNEWLRIRKSAFWPLHYEI
ncbi:MULTISPECIES: hypothetical protein [Paenibacillus]|uniref:hypothetical protein n=1 Tax=Paenibacillus TaxID=44249 RepID=UPI00203ABD6C|nr:hypothetical protein [Paenibacillus camelliae]MCM3633072.1 hypothetical protein [Paenibacillus camelliae]